MRYAVILAILMVSVEAWALKATAPNPLATPPTYWDQQNVGRMEGDQVIDMRDGRVQSMANLAEGPFPGSPEEAARAFLARHTDWVGLTKISPQTLRAVRTAESPMGFHVTFERYIGDVPVYPGDMVVTLDPQKIVRFYFSSLFVTVPENLPTKHALNAAEAVAIVTNYLQPKRPASDAPQTKLVIWAGDNRDFAVCWQVWQYLEDPMGDWEVLVDANTGAIRRAIDRACYVDGTGMIFRPDPLTSARVAYGSVGYVDNNDANSSQLQSQEFLDTLWNITLQGSTYSLIGPYCRIADFESPTGAPVTATNPDSFRFTRDAQGFEDVNVYYNITKSQTWIHSLGFTNIQNNSIWVDPHGLNGDDNSHYVPSSNRIAYGEGGVDDAEDADVIWHEYGHAIQNGSVPGWGGGDESSMGEGFGDYWAGSYSYSLSDYNNTWVFNWDGHNPFWDGRLLNNNYHYPQDNTSDIYRGGAIWSQACYETDLDIGREFMNRIVLQQHFLIGTGATMLTAANAILTADNSLYGGAHLAQIYAHFVPRGLLTAPPSFVLFTPKGGDLWPLDSVAVVQWRTGALGNNVSIELSRSGDAGPWEMLASSTTNDGTEQILVTGPRSDHCRIRVTYLGTPQRVLTSDSDFVIDYAHSLYYEDFEMGGPDWTHDAGGGWNDQWDLTVGEIHSGMVAYKCGSTSAGGYQAQLDARLTSPMIANLPEHAQLTFWHRMGAEVMAGYPDSANDGGIVEVSMNGGPFMQAAIGGYGYPTLIRSAGTPTGPFARGTQVCSGSHLTWAEGTVPLGQFAGGNIQFRFRFGSNNSVGADGWWIDDVRLIAAGATAVPNVPNAVPRTAALSCYPNPFNATTTIVLDIPQPAQTDITVFNTLGEQVAVLYGGALPAGTHNFRFGGGEMASGMYLVQVRSGEFLRRVKLLYLR